MVAACIPPTSAAAPAGARALPDVACRSRSRTRTSGTVRRGAAARRQRSASTARRACSSRRQSRPARQLHLVHVFANRSMQQEAIAKLIFDGVLDPFPRLRFRIPRAGAGWLPDRCPACTITGEARRRLRSDAEPRCARVPARVRARARRRGPPARCCERPASCWDLPRRAALRSEPAELERFQREHPHIQSDPLGGLARGQIFLTASPTTGAALPARRARRRRTRCAAWRSTTDTGMRRWPAASP